MKIVLKAVTVCFLIASVLSAQTEATFCTKGSKWFGGGFAFSSFGEGDYRLNMVQASPLMRFFPADHFMVGPGFSWTGLFMDGHSENRFGFGFDIGGVFSSKGGTYPYFRSGGNIITSGNEYTSSMIFAVPIAGGIIIPVNDFIGCQIEPIYTIVWDKEGDLANIFGFSIGFCAIGEKTLISVLQSVTGFNL